MVARQGSYGSGVTGSLERSVNGESAAAINNRVLFEVDDHGVTEGWSVIVRGTARVLRTHEEIEEVERAQLLPWTATTMRTNPCLA